MISSAFAISVDGDYEMIVIVCATLVLPVVMRGCWSASCCSLVGDLGQCVVHQQRSDDKVLLVTLIIV